jgi:hypothetical protein
MKKQFYLQVVVDPNSSMLSTDQELCISLELVLTNFFKIWCTKGARVKVANISNLDLVLSPRGE